MKHLTLLAAAAMLSAVPAMAQEKSAAPAAAAASAHPDTSAWQPLFKADLSDAEFKAGVWTVADGVITASEDESIWTKEQHENYTLDLEFKTGNRTVGCQIKRKNARVGSFRAGDNDFVGCRRGARKCECCCRYKNGFGQ